MSRIRIEGLLAAFPKLVGTGKQHTYVETENVRYLYQPIEVRRRGGGSKGQGSRRAGAPTAAAAVERRVAQPRLYWGVCISQSRHASTCVAAQLLAAPHCAPSSRCCLLALLAA
jgi:hypothetical protein